MHDRFLSESANERKKKKKDGAGIAPRSFLTIEVIKSLYKTAQVIHIAPDDRFVPGACASVPLAETDTGAVNFHLAFRKQVLYFIGLRYDLHPLPDAHFKLA